ncbi:hypothetical protein DRO59_05815 [Candidatus Bathyarchaeota archaeon]|nr:MAG: hypothetical protein DRO59_05815 [Candidatus Bathyarchaeota archaeon]
MHNASVITKFLVTAALILLVITTNSVLALLAYFALILLYVTFSKLPLVRILRWALYPAFFATFFALSQIQYSLILPVITVLKAVDAALIMLLFINTTPYPQVFSILSRVSKTLGNIAFLTYRFFFIFIEQADKRFTTLKVRGGLAGGLKRTIRNISHFIGSLFITFIDISQDTYYAMRVRGYNGIISCRPGGWMRVNIHDFTPVSMFLCFLIIAIFYWLHGGSGVFP